MDADGSKQTNLTDDLAADVDAAWSPDGSRIVFVDLRDGNGEIYVVSSDGAELLRLTNSAPNESRPDWRPAR